MDSLTQRLKALSSAEDFFVFFGVPYDEQVVRVNRLHILKRFYQYLHQAKGLSAGPAEGPAELGEIETFRHYRELLLKAYGDFVRSNAVTERVFKVFQEADGRKVVAVNSLRQSLADRRQAPRDVA